MDLNQRICLSADVPTAKDLVVSLQALQGPQVLLGTQVAQELQDWEGTLAALVRLFVPITLASSAPVE